MSTNAHIDLAPSEAVVLFVDLMGFSHEMGKLEISDSKRIEELATMLDRYAKEMTGASYEDEATRDFYGKRFWAFSDSVVVLLTANSGAEQIMSPFDARLDQLSSMAMAQGELLLSGRPLRGGIAAGWMHVRDNIVLGSALVNAAALEKKATNPFIAISDDLYRAFCESPSRNWYSKKADPVPQVFLAPRAYTQGLPVLNYFSVCLGNIDLTNEDIHLLRSRGHHGSDESWSTEAGELIFQHQRAFTLEHRDRVASGLSSASATVRSKYEALRDYHNEIVCSTFKSTAGLVLQ